MRVVFRRTANDTNGRAVVFEMFIPPNERGFARHVHPRQEERVDVLHGRIAFRVGRRRWWLGPGGRIVVPAGTPHSFRNADEGVAHVVCELRPALRFELLLEAVFALAATGAAGGREPQLLRRAAIADAHFDTVRAAFPPAWTQRLVLPVAARIARMLGRAESTPPT